MLSVMMSFDGVGKAAFGFLTLSFGFFGGERFFLGRDFLGFVALTP